MSELAEAESLFTPRNFIAFVIVSLIWGGTWLVIRDQIASVPASWSISYRFVIAALGMFALAALRREPLLLVAGGCAGRPCSASSSSRSTSRSSTMPKPISPRAWSQ
ncbi:hypothetical protein WKH79_10405 [Qipengyuania sp. GPGPB31]|uniref:hypothetical protein n=1 Tax=Qipengyuania sp. GPGPB31 TaxID=3023518 RepID=UPI003134459E